MLFYNTHNPVIHQQEICGLISAMNNTSSSSHQYLQVTHEGSEIITSAIANEAAVTLTVNGQVWLTFQCTPEDLEALSVGFLYNEGFIRSLDEVADIHVCDQKDNVDVWLTHSAQKPSSWRRTSGCHGGTTSADLERDHFDPVTSQASLRPDDIFSLMEQFLNTQSPHSESGGVHTSALADGATLLLQICDIGRHNTFDKIAGRILLEKLTVKTPVLLTSGRVSSDMLQKTVRIRAPFIISMRSTSQAGIQLAGEWGITLIGGARRGRFNLFAHPERIQPLASAQ